MDDPENFSDEELKSLLEAPGFSKKDLRPLLLRLFDKNDSHIRNDSQAEEGKMGKMNWKSFFRREKKFWRKIKKGNISKIILAEGDSWFEYPIFIDEIIDHLNKRDDYAIESLAYGGDWIANILYEQQYVEKLSLLRPDVFLISGGGNDLVGGHRLAQMIRDRKDLEYNNDLDLSSHDGKLSFAKRCFNKEFYSLMKLFKLQYKLLFEDIKMETDKFNDMKIITQGYDYAIPSSSLGFGFNPLHLMKPVTNWALKNGDWLLNPLLLRNYRNHEERVAIIYGMIECFNEMMISVGKDYDNVYHIDSRGAVNPKNGWYNELHPTSKEFKKIAKVYEKCIDSTDTGKKVYRVVDEV